MIVVEVMGHRAGWLALGAGIAGGADVILIPELPYDLEATAEAIRDRNRRGKTFSIVAVAEGALSNTKAEKLKTLAKEKEKASSKSARKAASEKLEAFHRGHVDHTVRLTQQLEEMTGLESRLTILGHLQRGGTPSPADRILATRLGAAGADALAKHIYGVMIAARGEGTETVPLEEVVGKKNFVGPDHPWVQAARNVGTSMGAPGESS